jgi:hypothetical protein
VAGVASRGVGAASFQEEVLAQLERLASAVEALVARTPAPVVAEEEEDDEEEEE